MFYRIMNYISYRVLSYSQIILNVSGRKNATFYQD